MNQMHFRISFTEGSNMQKKTQHKLMKVDILLPKSKKLISCGKGL